MNDNLTILTECCDGACANYTVFREDSCLVKLEVENSSLMDGRSYTCRLNDMRCRYKTGVIIEKPSQPIIEQFVCTSENAITVTFHRGAPNGINTDSYTVIMFEHLANRTIILCQSKTTPNLCDAQDQRCNCEYADKSNPFPFIQDVTIIVQVNRSFLFVEASKTYSVMENIQPGSLRNLSVVNISAHDAYVQFCANHQTCTIIIPLAKAQSPLWFNILVKTSQGIPECLQATLSSNEKCCIIIHLSLLKAFTSYTVVISGSSRGGESKKIMTEFSTTMIVPLLPPTTDDFSFSRFINETVLVVLWRALPHTAAGGSNLSYIVNVASESGYSVNQSVAESYAIFSDVTAGPLSVKIWAQNAVGHSENYTALEIPPYPEMKVLTVFVEFHGDRASVYVDLSDFRKIKLLAIHTCPGCRNCLIDVCQNCEPDICQIYPQSTFFNNTVRNHFEVVINQTDGQVVASSETRQIEYFNLINFHDQVDGPNYANATVTTWSSDNMDYDFDEDNWDPNNNDFYDIREKRDAGLLNQGTQIQPFHRIFISWMTEEGLWETGMIPASCYYDRTKETASVYIRFTDDDNGKPMLTVWTTCNRYQLQQFLVEYFLIYSSTDKLCKIVEGENLLENISNKIPKEEYTINLQSPVECACVEAYRSGLSGEPPTSCQQAKIVDDGGTKPGIIAAAAGVVIVMIILIIFICCCIRRKRHIQKMKDSGFHLPKHPIITTLTTRATPQILGGTSTNTSSMLPTTRDSERSTALCASDPSASQNNHVVPKNIYAPGTLNPHSLNQVMSEHKNSSGTAETDVSCSKVNNEEHEEVESDEEDDEQQQAFKTKGLTFININESVERSSFEEAECSSGISSV